MTNADRSAFAGQMVKLGEIFNEPVSAGRIAAYFEALDDVPAIDVLGAMHRAARVSKFFPRPAEIRELATGSVEERGTLAWGEVLREVRRVGWVGTPEFTDPAILPTIRRIYGSWQVLCESLPAAGHRGYDSAERSFVNHYTAATANEERLLETSHPLRVIEGRRG